MVYFGSFKSAELPEEKAFEALPAGWYQVTITVADAKPTKAGNGECLHLTYTVHHPQYQGRTVKDFIIYHHQNKVAQDIGLAKLNAIMQAVGLASLEDTNQLLGHALEVNLTIRTDGEYTNNEVKGRRAIQGVPQMPAGIHLTEASMPF